MQRSEINEEDKWDLTKIFKDEKEYNELYEKTIVIIGKIVQMKGRITERDKTLLEYLQLDEELDKCYKKICVYSYLSFYENLTDEKGKALVARVEKLTKRINEECSFASSELLKVSYDYIKSLVSQNDDLKKYEFELEKLFRYENHVLSEEEEKLISMAFNAFGTSQNAFRALNDSDSEFGSIIIDGKEVKITHSSYLILMQNNNREIRREAFEKLYNFYAQHKDTIAQLYKGQLREDVFVAKVRKFISPLEKALYSDDIDPDVYKNLIDTIHKKLYVLHNYLDYRRQFLGLDELHMYDMYVDLISGEEKTYTFEEGKDIILQAVEPLGEQYVKDLTKAFENRWIDKYPNDGKKSGAFQWGYYGIDPFVSINFNGTGKSIDTAAHELGHAMHTFYSNKKQEYIYSQYPIFLAEIASTVNQVLLKEYLINNAKTDEEKLFYITSLLDEFRSTLYRHTMFAEFEMVMHGKEQNEEIITMETLASTYYDLNKLYYGEDVVSDELIMYEWSRISLFYRPFYVYKYATGFSAALAIVSDILNGKEGAQERYLEFLSSGGSDYPLEILKKCGVDMTTSEPIEKATKIFEDKLSMAMELKLKIGSK